MMNFLCLGFLSPGRSCSSMRFGFGPASMRLMLRRDRERSPALHEMRRVLKPNGGVGIAVWTEIEDNEIFAAYYAALRATTPAELADLIEAPFSWPSGAALKAAAEEAGSQRSIDQAFTANGARRRFGTGGPRFCRHACLTRCCSPCARCAGRLLRPSTPRDEPAPQRWQGHRQDDIQHHRWHLLKTACLAHPRLLVRPGSPHPHCRSGLARSFSTHPVLPCG